MRPQSNNSHEFDYYQAFSRNIGWFTEEEQAFLRTKRIAVAGLGGVGGVHLLTLARLGFEKFVVADFDHFEIQNFNRQVGATISTLGKSKLDVLKSMILDINPNAEVRTFAEGVSKQNLNEFLRGVDVYVDSLDFFAFESRRATFAACARNNIPAVTAAPLGMGSAMLTFMPGGMSFEEYFQLEGCSEEEMAVRFLLGLAPKAQHRSYLVDPTRINLKERKGPSTMIACQLCSGMAAAETVKILLKRGTVKAAPWGVLFDAYKQKMVHTYRRGGNKHPMQKLMIAFAKKQLKIR